MQGPVYRVISKKDVGPTPPEEIIQRENSKKQPQFQPITPKKKEIVQFERPIIHNKT